MFRALKPYQIVVDLGVAAGFFLIAWPVEAIIANGSGGLPPSGMDDVRQELAALAVAALFSCAVGLRRLSPGLALGVAWGAALLQVGLGRSPSFSDIAIFAVLYATAAYGTQRVYWTGLASALVGALVITVYLMAGPGFANGLPSWDAIPSALLMLVAAAFALGLSWTLGALVRTAVRARESRLAKEVAEGDAVIEQERVRIARDMHDVVAHSLAVVIAQADGARYAATADPSVATEALGTISTTARAALADVRLLLTQLRHSQGDGPQPTIADLEALYAQVRAAGVGLRIDVDPAPSAQPPAGVQLAVYRILQESLTNALRHGDGSPVAVRLAWHPDRVDLEVRNRVPEGASGPAPGHGLIGMRERAQLAGGVLTATSEDGWFVVDAALPITLVPA